MHGTIYTTVQRYFLTTYGRSDSVLGSRDSAETRGGWAGSLPPWALARGEAGKIRTARGVRVDAGANALLSFHFCQASL